MEQQPLVCASHKKEYIGMIILGILIGTGASFVYFKQAPVDSPNTYQAGFDAARKLVEQSSVGPMLQVATEVHVLFGTVTTVNGNSITIHTQSMNPFDDPSLADRTILVNANTKIYKLFQKDPKTMQTEMASFAKTIQSNKSGTLTTPPEPFVRTSTDISSIVVGDILNVTAIENIKTIKEFLASEIQIQPNMTTPINN